MNKYYVGNANVFLDGGDTTGQLKEFEIDNIKANTEKFESLGMLANKDVPVGFEQMAGKFTFSAASPDFFNKGAFPWESIPVTVLGVMTDKTLGGTAGLNKQLEVSMIIRPSEVGVGKYASQKLTEFERSFYIDKITLSFAGVEQLHFDSENNIYRINGVDKWKEYRTLLGQ